MSQGIIQILMKLVHEEIWFQLLSKLINIFNETIRNHRKNTEEDQLDFFVIYDLFENVPVPLELPLWIAELPGISVDYIERL